MTPEERDQLVRFLQLLEQAQAGPKDPEAQALIAQACAHQPDAAYLLVQRVMQLEHAQQASQAEIARLTQQVGEARTSALPPSFFGGNAWGRRPSGAGTGAPVSVPATAAAVNLGAPAVQPPAPQSTWGSGLLGTVASTAVGVVAGSMLAQGIGSLLGHHNEAKAAGTDHAAIPPGGGSLVETDYGAGGREQDGGYVAEDFDTDGGGDVDAA